MIDFYPKDLELMMISEGTTKYHISKAIHSKLNANWYVRMDDDMGVFIYPKKPTYEICTETGFGEWMPEVDPIDTIYIGRING